MDQAKAAYQSGLGITDHPKELADEIDELHRLRQEHPEHDEVTQVFLAMLIAWKPGVG